MAADLQIISVIGANGQPLPIHGNSIGSNWSMPVKQERADEAEIQELAAKMLETQKAALAKQQQQAAQLANRQVGAATNGLPQQVASNGQTNILNYLSRQPKLPNGTTVPVGASSNGRAANGDNGSTSSNALGHDKKTPCDEESQKGHFGWTTFGKTYIPYIYRQQEKYCSVRMIELKLIGKYLNYLHPDIYSSCTCVRSYYITEAEARLFFDINHKHCDDDFGRDTFTQKDLVVRLSDATKFYQFLDICYRKLISGSKSPSEKCGFIRINKESVVPYTVRNNEQVVPLFYFEGETENLKQKADYLSGWDLAYLKFCCKVQGIRNELFSSENVAVISLTDIKSYFPNGTEFEDYWPSKVVDSNLLIGNNRSNATNSVNWTRQPTQPPPKVIPQQQQLSQKSQSAAAAAAAAAQQQTLLKRGAAGVNAFNAQTAAMQQQQQQQQQQQPNQRMHTNALTQATVQALANASWMSPQNNIPLMHAQMMASQQAQQTHPGSRGAPQYRNPMDNLMLGNRQPYTYNNGAISMQPVNSHSQGNAPPPLVRSAGGQNSNHMSNVEQTMLQQQQSQQQQQRHSSTTSSTSALTNFSPQNNSTSTPSSPSTINPFANFNLNQLNSNLARVPPPHSPGGGSGIGGIGVSPTDFTNLAFWNQLTANQRLLLTQQFKNSSTILGAANAFSGAAQFPPSLPLNAVTDLKSMLDYKPKPPTIPTNSSSATMPTNNGQFTKPNVPPLIPMSALEAAAEAKRNNSINRYPAPPSNSASSASSSVPLNSSSALEDFNKKFKMTDEMRAVVQKVLANPDLSTFIQTNSSSGYVPFISPPISPAIGASASPSRSTMPGGGGGGGYHHQFNNSTSLSIVPNPNVTITPQLPAHFSHPNQPNSPSSVSAAARQKSVICSTTAVSALNVPPSPSTSASTPSPSPTRLASTAATSALKSTLHNPSSHSNHHHHNNHHSQQQQHHHHYHHKQAQQQQTPPNTHHHTIPPMDVIDLSSPRRSLQAASAYLQQQQQQQAAQQQAHQAAAVAAVQQQQRLAAAQHHSQQNGRSSSSSNSNSASMHLQRHAALAAVGGGAVGGGGSAGGDSNNRLCIIPEIPTGNMNVQPYKVQKVYVDNHLVPCINMKAYNDSEQLMTLTDFQKYFFPTVPLEHCKRIIEALGVELYKGNRRQLQILMENDRSHNENIPLVQVRDIIRYMPQLTFMFRNQEQPPTKRTRIS